MGRWSGGWAAWAKPQGIDRAVAVVLARPAFFKAFAALVPRVPLRTWQNWLVARYVTAAAPFLSAPFDNALVRKIAELSYGVYLIHLVVATYVCTALLALPTDGSARAVATTP